MFLVMYLFEQTSRSCVELCHMRIQNAFNQHYPAPDPLVTPLGAIVSTHMLKAFEIRFAHMRSY